LVGVVWAGVFSSAVAVTLLAWQLFCCYLWLFFVTNSRVGLWVGGLGSGLVLGCFFGLGFELVVG